MTSPVSQPASSEARKTAARHVLGLAEAARGRIRDQILLEFHSHDARRVRTLPCGIGADACPLSDFIDHAHSSFHFCVTVRLRDGYESFWSGLLYEAVGSGRLRPAIDIRLLRFLILGAIDGVLARIARLPASPP